MKRCPDCGALLVRKGGVDIMRHEAWCTWDQDIAEDRKADLRTWGE